MIWRVAIAQARQLSRVWQADLGQEVEVDAPACFPGFEGSLDRAESNLALRCRPNHAVCFQGLAPAVQEPGPLRQGIALVLAQSLKAATFSIIFYSNSSRI